MDDIEIIGGSGPVEIIPIHFDVPGHYVPLHLFIETARRAEGVVAALNDELFGGELTFEFLVFPPESGTFKTKLGIAIVAGWGVVWSFTESDIGQAFIKGLTEHEPAYWAEMAGRSVREQLAVAPDASDHGVESRVRRKFENVIISESTKSFLQKETQELRRIGIGPLRFRDAFEARNEFYQECLKEPQLRAVGFDETEEFPIDRKSFVELQVALAPREEAASRDPWHVEIVELKVTSPNWDREDDARPWKAKDHKGRNRTFRIDDEGFWGLVARGALNLHGIDTIRVQWAYQGEGRQKKNVRVLRVLEYNGDKLAEPLDEHALEAIVGEHDARDPDAPGLFDD